MQALDSLARVKPVFAIYVDEYGETGADLTSPQQPVYVFLATLVPAGSPYLRLEGELHRIAEGLASSLEWPGHLPLHAVDLYQRKGPYRQARGGKGLGVEEAMGWFRSVLAGVFREAEAFVGVHVEKPVLVRLLGSELGGVPRLTRAKLRQLLFTLLLREVEFRLREAGGYGFVLFERSGPGDPEGFSEVLPFEALRREGRLRVLGVPSPIGKGHLMGAAADFPAYVYGRHLKATRGWEPPRSEMERWFKELVEGRLSAKDVAQEVGALLRNPVSWEELWPPPPTSTY